MVSFSYEDAYIIFTKLCMSAQIDLSTLNTVHNTYTVSSDCLTNSEFFFLYLAYANDFPTDLLRLRMESAIELDIDMEFTSADLRRIFKWLNTHLN